MNKIKQIQRELGANRTKQGLLVFVSQVGLHNTKTSEDRIVIFLKLI